MADLPDFYSFVQTIWTKVGNITSGLDAAKATSPTVGDVYLATDTTILYVCYAVGTWVNAGALYLLLAGGTMAGAIAMGANKITELGAPTAAGDALRKGTAITTTELPNLTQGRVWQGNVSNRPAEAAIPGATQEFFVPAMGGTDPTFLGYFVNGASDNAYMLLIVPQDFTSITDLEVIFLPWGTGASMNFVILTQYGAYVGGESYAVHTETADPRNIGATVIGQHVAHSISDLVDVAALAAGDVLMVKVTYDAAAIASNAYVRGIRLKYA